jgi:hypothetical protein
MDCSTGKGGKVKRVRIGIKNNDGEGKYRGKRSIIKMVGSGMTKISVLW